MILVLLEKRKPTEKFYVKSWEYVTKEIAATIKELINIRELVDDADIPNGFYKNHNQYFLENKKLRYAVQ